MYKKIFTLFLVMFCFALGHVSLVTAAEKNMYSMGTVYLGGQPETSIATTTTESKKIKKVYFPQPQPELGLGGVDPKFLSQEDINDFTSTDTFATTSTSSFEVTPVLDTNPQTNEPNMNQMGNDLNNGPFDFFGISAWFWLVILLLLVLGAAILYMQSL